MFKRVQCVVSMVVRYQIKKKYQQESRRAYGTAVSRVVIHLNKIHLNHCQIVTIGQCSNNPKPNQP